MKYGIQSTSAKKQDPHESSSWVALKWNLSWGVEIRGSGVSICKRSFDQTIDIKENKQKLSYYCYFTIFVFSSFVYLGFFFQTSIQPWIFEILCCWLCFRVIGYRGDGVEMLCNFQFLMQIPATKLDKKILFLLQKLEEKLFSKVFITYKFHFQRNKVHLFKW